MSRPLPPHPDLTQLKNRAKTLLKAHKNGDAGVCRFLRTLPRFADVNDQDILATDVALHDVQRALALDYGFRNWAVLKAHVLATASPAADATDAESEESDTVTSGDVADPARTQKETCHGERPMGDCSIGGTVIAQDTGEPLQHARVYLFYCVTHTAVFIDVAGDGSFCFSDIPPGPYSLQTTHTRGYQAAVYNPDGKPGQYPHFTLADGEQREGLVLAPQPACSIEGTVFDEHGEPLHGEDSIGFFVLAWERDHGDGAVWRSAGQCNVVLGKGFYRLDFLSGGPVYLMALDWRAYAKDLTYPPRYYPGAFARGEATPITFEEERQLQGIDIRLARHGGLVLEGTVTDEGTGKPVPEAFVVVHPDDMRFAFSTAYTDAHGRYRVEGLGEGALLAHVDAVHRGLVRTREPVRIGAPKTKLDFTLRRGVTISGRLTDESGAPWQIAESYGHASIEGHPRPRSSFSLTGFRNRYRPADIQDDASGSYEPGQGDYGTEEMVFSTKSTFIVQGLMPGRTRISFEPKKEGQAVKQVLHRGQDITTTAFETHAGETIEDIVIVVGAEARSQT